MTKAYPAYKDSGVEWLGEVPEGWQIVRLKHACNVFPSNVDKHSIEGEIPVSLCNYTDVYYRETITPDIEFMQATARPDEIAKFSLQIGDVIFTKDSETADDIGIAAMVEQELPGVVCGYHLSIARPRDGVSGSFVKRFFDSRFAKACFQVSANGLTRVGLGQSAIDNVTFPLPSLPEQTAIAAFLDRETAKIDALVAEQRRLIDLLREKRQAVISHAVTKGLNPTAPLKPSGIDWLGDVPEGWEVKKVSFVCERMTYGFTNPMPTTDDGPFMLTAADIENGAIAYGTARRTSKYAFENLLTDKSRPIAGDVLITKDGTLGRVAVADGSSVCINQSVALLRLVETEMQPHFLAKLLSGSVHQSRMMYEAGGTTIKHIYISRLAQMPIPVPPIVEQGQILNWLEARLPQFDNLICEGNSALVLLQERRAALISAAVTGKIDVRHLAPQETAAA